jgi:hypothetical protein
MGIQQEPGGWNRVALRVADLPGLVVELGNAGIASATRWTLVPVVVRSEPTFLTAVPSTYSNQLAKQIGRGGSALGAPRRHGVRVANPTITSAPVIASVAPKRS